MLHSRPFHSWPSKVMVHKNVFGLLVCKYSIDVISINFVLWRCQVQWNYSKSIDYPFDCFDYSDNNCFVYNILYFWSEYEHWLSSNWFLFFSCKIPLRGSLLCASFLCVIQGFCGMTFGKMNIKKPHSITNEALFGKDWLFPRLLPQKSMLIRWRWRLSIQFCFSAVLIIS